MKNNPKKNDISSKYYSMNEFLQDLRKLSGNEELEQKTINTFNTNSLDAEFSKKEYRTPLHFKSEMRNQLNEKIKLLNQEPGNYVNEVMKSELKILSKENAELKFCINNLNKKFEKEMKDLKLQNLNKSKEIQGTKEIIKKNTALIELLGGKIMNYEKIFKEIELKNEQKTFIDKNIKDKLLEAQKENEKLKKDIDERDEIIKSFKDEIDSKKEIFEEIDKMKNDMETYLKTMDQLYKEIEKKDKEINDLKKNMELMNTKHKQDLENISKNKNTDINNITQIIPSSNEEVMNKLAESKQNQIQITKELIDTQKHYTEAKNYNIKMQNITKEASDMIKKSIEARDKIKEEYDKAIKDLVEKYEKQIQFMKLVIVEQNEKYEKELADSKEDDKKNDGKNNNNEDNKIDLDDEEKNKYLDKLKKDNKMLIEQNLELKKMNDMLISKMELLPNLDNKFNELFTTVKKLKEENELLKKSMKNNKYFKLLNQTEKEEDDEKEQEKEEKINTEKKEEKEKDKENEENPKLSYEELQMLENLINDVENNTGGNEEENMKKLVLLEEVLKKLENKNEEDNKEIENNEEEVEENEEQNNNADLNLKKQLLLEAMAKTLGEEGLDDNNEDIKNKENKKNINNDLPFKLNNINTNIKNDESNKDKDNIMNKTNKIYNKKLLKTSPKLSENKKNKNNLIPEIDNEHNDNDNDNNQKIKSTEENEEEEEDDQSEDNIPNQINENFNLYKPTKEGMLSFSLSKKNYSNIIPNKFDEFLKVFDPDTSLQYNTLEGLFIIPSNKCNQLYYYSGKKNTISELFLLKENHSGGCLFLDNISKNIIVLGGSESKAVEKFSFESGKLEQLPQLSTYRSKITCNQIGNKIFCFFGISKERPNESIVEYLDLDNIDEGWKEIDFINNADFNVISGMSCINLNDNELLIIGGLLNDEIPNEKLLTFNIEEKELKKLENNLPDSDDKVYLFTQNTMFNLFVNGDIITFANIDDNNQVHVLDNELCYDLYLIPKTN